MFTPVPQAPGYVGFEQSAPYGADTGIDTWGRGSPLPFWPINGGLRILSGCGRIVPSGYTDTIFASPNSFNLSPM